MARFSGQLRRAGVRLARTRTRDYIATSERMTMFDRGDLRASNLPTYPCLFIKRAHAPCPDGQGTTRWLPGGCGLNVRSCEPISPLGIGSAGPRTQTPRSRVFRRPIALGGGGDRAEIGYVHIPR